MKHTHSHMHTFTVHTCRLRPSALYSTATTITTATITTITIGTNVARCRNLSLLHFLSSSTFIIKISSTTGDEHKAISKFSGQFKQQMFSCVVNIMSLFGKFSFAFIVLYRFGGRKLPPWLLVHDVDCERAREVGTFGRVESKM